MTDRWPLALLVALTLTVGLAAEVRADWRRTTDLNYHTAFTLEEDAVEVGIFAPLVIGATDEVQVALHPILLLLGQPYLAVRWRATRYDVATLALNVGATWSFIRATDSEGRPESQAVGATGFPGTTQLTANVTFRAGDRVLLTAGAGPALDFLGETPIRGLIQCDLSAHWLVVDDQLLMMTASGYLDVVEGGGLRRPQAQLLYAFAVAPTVHIAVGLSLGNFIFETEAQERSEVHVLPIVDVWFRF